MTAFWLRSSAMAKAACSAAFLTELTTCFVSGGGKNGGQEGQEERRKVGSRLGGQGLDAVAGLFTGRSVLLVGEARGQVLEGSGESVSSEGVRRDWQHT